ncbi:MAG: hypothetical protein HOP17_00950 [Acidobacteria bacterium]|nr:hypothetical protein [Acidobacteriota bacterium]
MINTSNLKKFLTVGAAVAGAILLGGQFNDANGQRDPFQKPGWAITRDQRGGGPGGVKKPSGVTAIQAMVPSIEQRIEFFKRLRETAAMNGQPLPKVTSVLTLNEMAVTGIFKTPRGYAAMVEATPIKLSYTIYPGEKFFDGQLVAVEENRLVFRRVTKMAKNKFVASVENKTLRKYSVDQEIQGTAPAQADGKPPETIATYQPAAPPADPSAPKPAPVPVVSPLDEMNSQVPESDAKKAAKATAKKPVKVAKNK